MVEEQPWDSETAEKYIHQLGSCDKLALTKTNHATERMLERGIIDYDIFYILKRGKVIESKTESATRGFFKYAIQSKAPNSEGVIRLIVIPCLDKIHMTLITVMWRGDNGEWSG